MKPRTLLILTVVVLVLGAFILFYEKDLGSTDERKELEGRLVPVEAEEVAAVTFGQGDDAVRLERVDFQTDDDASDDDARDDAVAASSWRLAAPLEARAVAGEVDAFLTRLDGLRRERAIEGGARADLGLETPRAVFTLEVDDEPIVVRVGEELPLGGTVAVEIERDGEATVVEASSFAGDLLDKVRRPAAEWRDPLLFTGLRNDVERIVLERGTDRLVLARGADAGEGDDLRLVEPIEDAADDPALNALLTGLTSFEAASFVDADARTDFAPIAFAEVTLRGVDEPFRVAIGPAETGPERLVRVDSSMGGDQQVRADVEWLLEALDRPIEGWRSLDLTGLQVFELDAASFEGPAVETATGAERLELERVEGQWRKTADGEPVDVDYTRATDVLYPLADARAVELTSETSASEVSADASLRVELRTADAVETLSILPAVGGRHAVRVDGRDSVLHLPAAVVDEVLGALGAIDDPPEEVDPGAGGFETLGLDEIDPILGGLGGQPAPEHAVDHSDDQEITP